MTCIGRYINLLSLHLLLNYTRVYVYHSVFMTAAFQRYNGSEPTLGMGYIGWKKIVKS
jgi:hypothetical protein